MIRMAELDKFLVVAAVVDKILADFAVADKFLDFEEDSLVVTEKGFDLDLVDTSFFER